MNASRPNDALQTEPSQPVEPLTEPGDPEVPPPHHPPLPGETPTPILPDPGEPQPIVPDPLPDRPGPAPEPTVPDPIIPDPLPPRPGEPQPDR